MRAAAVVESNAISLVARPRLPTMGLHLGSQAFFRKSKLDALRYQALVGLQEVKQGERRWRRYLYRLLPTAPCAASASGSHTVD